MTKTIDRLSDLTHDPQNRRTHNARNLDMLRQALTTVGASRSIVIDEAGEILAGNGVVEAAYSLGLDKVRIVDVDGDTVVAVRRSGLTPDQKRDLAIYDNRTAELAEWNWPQLATDRAAGVDLQPWFTPAELKAALDEAGPPVDDRTASQFLIVITCPSEAYQVDLLKRFTAEGVPCKALVS